MVDDARGLTSAGQGCVLNNGGKMEKGLVILTLTQAQTKICVKRKNVTQGNAGRQQLRSELARGCTRDTDLSCNRGDQTSPEVRRLLFGSDGGAQASPEVSSGRGNQTSGGLAGGRRRGAGLSVGRTGGRHRGPRPPQRPGQRQADEPRPLWGPEWRQVDERRPLQGAEWRPAMERPTPLQGAGVDRGGDTKLEAGTITGGDTELQAARREACAGAGGAKGDQGRRLSVGWSCLGIRCWLVECSQDIFCLRSAIAA